MRVAIVADIHSNLHALKAVAEAIGKERVHSTICAGDVVGYGAFPDECAAIIRDLADTIVLGNHDWSAISRDTTGMNPHAAAASRWTSENLDSNTIEFLGSLGMEAKRKLSDMKVAVYHGSVGSYLQYVYEEDIDQRLLNRAEADVLILGHTHVPYARKLSNGLAINPGSVGQPRDGDPRASYAIFDSDSRLCTIKRLDYDVQGAAEAIADAGLPRALADRLFYGR